MFFRYPDSAQGASSPALMCAEVVGDDQVVTIGVCGEVDIATAQPLLTAVRHGLAEQPLRLSIELSRVSFFSAAGLRALLTARRLADERAVELVLTSPSRQVMAVLELIQARQLFTVVQESPRREPNTDAADAP